MRVYISVDFEGVAGVVDFSQGDTEGGVDWQLGRELMTEETNAAIEGAIEAGATEIVVNDAHGKCRNLIPSLMHPKASLIQGRVKPGGIAEGLDGSFDAVFCVGYHAPPDIAASIMTHAYHPFNLRYNGKRWSEVGLIAWLAGHFNVPIALVTGDEATVEDERERLPPHVGVAVKRGITRYAAESLHPEVARERIKDGATSALDRLAQFKPFEIDYPMIVEEELYYSQQADMVELIPGIERIDARTIQFRSDNALEAYRTFMATAFIAQHPTISR